MRLERLSRAALDEQRLEDVLDSVRGPERLLDVCSALPRPHERQVARLEVAEPFRLEDERHARREVRLADDELAAPADLDDDRLGDR